MASKKIYFIVTEENINKIYKSNSFLIDELSKKFDFIYILNLYNLKLFSEKKKFKFEEKITDKLFVINFDNTNEFKKFAVKKSFVAIIITGKDPSYFNIHYQINKLDIKLIMIMNLSQIGNKMTADINLKYFFFAYKHYFNKGFYYFFRIMTLINIFPKIDLLFESNMEIKQYIENSRSKKIEKYFPSLKLSYFREVVPVNSIYFDKMNLFLKTKKQNNKNIIYVDTHFEHPDRLFREGRVDPNKQNNFYEKLSNFLKNISEIYDMPVIISKHPKNNSDHKFYKSFEISQRNTEEEIFHSEIAVYTLSSAILNAVILKKKIINIQSKLLGEYMENINKQYVKNLGLVSYDIDQNYIIKKDDLDDKLKKSIDNYENYIKYKLITDGNNLSCKKISEVISAKFFDNKKGG